MTKKDAEKIYDLGKEAIIDILVRLFGYVEQIKQLKERIAHLEAILNQNSKNSSKPPSSDSFNKPKSDTKRKKGKRKSGGQKGHPGKTLQKSENPDIIDNRYPQVCSCCKSNLTPESATLLESRQVFDIPEPKIIVTEISIFMTNCPHCNESNVTKFPEHVDHYLQYGPNIKAQMVYLQYGNYIPYERCQQFFEDIYDITISEGTLINTAERVFDALEPFEKTLSDALIEQPVIHVDETSNRLDKNRVWLHVCSTDSLTHIGWHYKRGKVATDNIGILLEYEGIMVHDHWKPYFKYNKVDHALCNAHHVRELEGIFQQGNQKWAEELQNLLFDMNDAVSVAIDADELVDDACLEEFDSKYDEILEEGLSINPRNTYVEPKSRGKPKQSKAYNLLIRLRDYKTETLRFLYDFRVPFTNNQAERDIRMAKLRQKISGCFRSERGIDIFCRMRSYLSTMKKQKQHIFKSLVRIFADPDSINEIRL
jgi:transposase